MRRLALFALLGTSCLKLRPAPDEKIERTSSRIERGRYLANAVFACVACHSTPDETLFARPPKAGTEPGAGGQCWHSDLGFPGRLCAPNLTNDDETGIGLYTDGEVMRAIREGIDNNGDGMFPLMPYRDYASISDEDTRALVAYLRTLPATKNPVAEKDLDFPVGLFIRAAPRPLDGPVPEPDHGDAVEYGRYLGKGCVRCHSPVDSRSRIIAGRELSGGQVFKLTGGAEVVSPNLTPHPTGLGSWTEAQFKARMKSYREPAPAVEGKNTVMPWLAFAELTDEDLGALWAWLASVPPLENKVTAWP